MWSKGGMDLVFGVGEIVLNGLEGKFYDFIIVF